MKNILPAAVTLGLLMAGATFAQTATQPASDAASSAPPGSYPATSESAPPRDPTLRDSAGPAAIANPRDTMKTSAAPVPGKNSFTFAQARKRLEANGYTQITGLSKDRDSVWRAQATKRGKQTGVALDYQGNIVETP